ncbi:hypothetical protein XENTR_v10006294 [Xenopus tropicalis]|nr:hypothetical protein XENTR_v10006294 [Xenopus tropicalis]
MVKALPLAACQCLLCVCVSGGTGGGGRTAAWNLLAQAWKGVRGVQHIGFLVLLRVLLPLCGSSNDPPPSLHQLRCQAHGALRGHGHVAAPRSGLH